MILFVFGILMASIFKTVMSLSPIPKIIYGCAWKKEKTAELVELALKSGFRGIDTAAQPKHYNELGSGEGIQKFLQENSNVKRTDLFIQTKFTSINGQDPTRIPYDEHAPLQSQVKQSFENSLNNLKTEYIDALILHSPMHTFEETIIVWREFEKLYDEGKVRYLGISNCYNLNVFQKLYNEARIKPKFLQNRFYQKSNFDTELRAFCISNNVYYESFWTLTANRHFLQTSLIKELASKYNVTPQEIFFAFTKSCHIIPLSGTKNEQHMKEDLRATNGSSLVLEAEEVKKIKMQLMG